MTLENTFSLPDARLPKGVAFSRTFAYPEELDLSPWKAVFYLRADHQLLRPILFSTDSTGAAVLVDNEEKRITFSIGTATANDIEGGAAFGELPGGSFEWGLDIVPIAGGDVLHRFQGDLRILPPQGAVEAGTAKAFNVTLATIGEIQVTFASVIQGAAEGGSETPATVKTKYESNADTNAFTDAEKAKLGGVEVGAKDDQTGAEIKAAYEGEANTNAFTDAEKAKLGGIEAGAKDDQTGAEIKTAYEGEANTNAFTDAEKAKLAGIVADHYGDPVQDLVELAALAEAGLTDKERRFVEDEIADYFFDATAVAGDVAPNDQTGGAGFWRKTTAGGESAASVKTKYESNADTNAFTDAEKAKLGGIEAGAKDDQTGAEIKAAYEGEADTNAFTDAEKAKLGGIEAGAKDDQTDEEIRAAYETARTLMSQAEAEAGVETIVRLVNATRLRQAIDARIATLIDGSPAALDTLNEIAAALGDDPNFAATMTAALAGKQPLDATLTAFAALAGGADKLPYFSGGDSFSLADLSAFGRSLLALADLSALKGAIGEISQVDVEAGTSPTFGLVSPQRIKQAIDALAPEGGGAGADFAAVEVAADSPSLSFELGTEAVAEFFFENLLPANDTRSLYAYVSDDDAATWEGAGYQWIGDGRNGGSQNYANGFLNLTAGKFIGADVNECGLSGWLRIYAPNEAGSRVKMSWQVVFVGNDGFVGAIDGGGFWDTAGALTNIKFEPNSGNFASGKIRKREYNDA